MADLYRCGGGDPEWSLCTACGVCGVCACMVQAMGRETYMGSMGFRLGSHTLVWHAENMTLTVDGEEPEEKLKVWM